MNVMDGLSFASVVAAARVRVVRDVCVLGLGHAGGGDAEAEEAGVEAGEFGFDGGVVEESLWTSSRSLALCWPVGVRTMERT